LVGHHQAHLEAHADGIHSANAKGNPMIPLALLLALMQQPQYAADKSLPIDSRPAKPLTCPKYQHVEGATSLCPCDSSGCKCEPPKPKCVDDMHEVTEKEWQELMARLKKLEGSWIKPEYTKDDPPDCSKVQCVPF